MDRLDQRLAKYKGSQDALIDKIRRSVVGHDATFTTQLGLNRRLVYCDYFASGRSLSFIESTIQDHILPFYANTHTTSTHTGLYTTKQRELARDAIRRSVNAPKDEYAVIWTGSGSTSSILHMIGALRLWDLSRWNTTSNPPVVFVSVMEHHSNLLPWRECAAKLVTIPMDAQGVGPDLGILESQLKLHKSAPLLIGSFSAGSNLTGVPMDVHRIAKLIHAYDGLVFFDYAGVGPYVPINVRGTVSYADAEAADRQGWVSVSVPDCLDAVYISPHKFIGGPGTPGVLVAHRGLLSASSTPANPGGGSVRWVTMDATEYLTDLEEREESGTPDIVGSIRCGMAFAVKDAVGAEAIQAKEFKTARRVIASLRKMPNVILLGHPEVDRVPVFSFVVRSPYAAASGRALFLHHGFVSTILNDLFGIQTRAGCMCAGLFGQYLLSMNEKDTCSLAASPSTSDNLPSSAGSPSPSRPESTWLDVFKPGYVRLSFNYFTPSSEIDYVLAAVEFVSTHGHLMLPYYAVDPKSGAWRPRPNVELPTFEAPTAATPVAAATSKVEKCSANLFVRLDRVRAMCEQIASDVASEFERQVGSEERARLRRFALPKDVCQLILLQ
ncbi:pyridoxal phosphate-dependent transferase [Catenaria anguillulae PL171]|uniref:Pyridoxal phosphate-dependent transferase n=1 Tax=Catenaria anguillulae PL171 TaxID=765915 RepID=A0A1Y2I4L5_9FUNG|nr:pyridoxal phosphate-dependent transferase [Catenaria anguillulae PL171]